MAAVDVQVLRLAAYVVTLAVYSFQLYFSTTLTIIYPRNVLQCNNHTAVINDEMIDTLFVSEIIISWLIVVYYVKCMFVTMKSSARLPQDYFDTTADEEEVWLTTTDEKSDEDPEAKVEHVKRRKRCSATYGEQVGSVYKYLYDDCVTCSCCAMVVVVVTNFLYMPAAITVIILYTGAGILFQLGAMSMTLNDIRRMTYSVCMESVMKRPFGSTFDGIMVAVVENATLYSGIVFVIKSSTLAELHGYQHFNLVLLGFYSVFAVYNAFGSTRVPTHCFIQDVTAIVVGAFGFAFCDVRTTYVAICFFAVGCCMVTLNLGFAVMPVLRKHGTYSV